MSLRDAVLEIADQMESEAGEYKNDASYSGRLIGRDLIAFARQLRSAVRSADELSSPGLRFTNPEAQHAAMIAKARTDLCSAAGGEAPDEIQMRECVGGPAHETMTAVDPKMPVGARMFVAGAVYQLRSDGKLEHLPS